MNRSFFAVFMLVGTLVQLGVGVGFSQDAIQAGELVLSEDEKRLIAAMKAYSTAAIPKLEAGLLDAKKRFQNGRMSRSSYQAGATGKKKRLSQFQNGHLQIPILSPNNLKAGNIGKMLFGIVSTINDKTFEENHFSVFQIVDDQNMVIQTENTFVQDVAYNVVHASKKLIWVVGVSTDGLTDDGYVKLGGIMEVAGTHRYETARGSTNTIVEITPFPIQDLDLIEKLIAEVKQTEKMSKQLSKFRGKHRTWKNESGKFSVVAKYLRREGPLVILEKKDGPVIKVPFKKLSAKDQKKIDLFDPIKH